MRRFLVPRIARRDRLPMIGAAVVGGLIAGGYGMIHDSVTFSISPEYFTKLKFDQFRWADVGLPDRWFAVEVGFLASGSVGFLCAWFLARRLIPGQPRRRASRRIGAGFAIVLASALSAAGLGFAYGLWRGPGADYSLWQPTLAHLSIVDPWAFLRVAFIHNAGYLGAFGGLILALVYVRP